MCEQSNEGVQKFWYDSKPVFRVARSKKFQNKIGHTLFETWPNAKILHFQIRFVKMRKRQKLADIEL